jgi:hypothetical protein
VIIVASFVNEGRDSAKIDRFQARVFLATFRRASVYLTRIAPCFIFSNTFLSRASVQNLRLLSDCIYLASSMAVFPPSDLRFLCQYCFPITSVQSRKVVDSRNLCRTQSLTLSHREQPRQHANPHLNKDSMNFRMSQIACFRDSQQIILGCVPSSRILCEKMASQKTAHFGRGPMVPFGEWERGRSVISP